MAVYEVTMLYPDRSYDEHRRFLGSVAASPPSGLDGFRRHGSGIALTFFVESDLGPDLARKLAVQRAAGLWPNHRAAESAIHVSPDRSGPATAGAVDCP